VLTANEEKANEKMMFCLARPTSTPGEKYGLFHYKFPVPAKGSACRVKGPMTDVIVI
jgi:hypothetical protein